jgi:S1-C subfamily serine protease
MPSSIRRFGRPRLIALGAVVLVLLAGVEVYVAPRPSPPSEAQFLHNLEASVITMSVDLVRGNKKSGSGFFIGHDGVLLTNAHVIIGAVAASGVTLDGEAMPVQIVGIKPFR